MFCLFPFIHKVIEININNTNFKKIGLIVGLWHWLINESADLHNDQATRIFGSFFELKVKIQTSKKHKQSQ